MKSNSQKKHTSLSAFSILYGVLFVLAGLTWVIPEVDDASFGSVVMASYKGFKDATDVCFFVLVLSGFLGVISKTGALHAGIAQLVKNFKGRERALIPLIMFLFSIGGTTFGFAEETLAFYGLITATMVAAGFDSTVGAATVLLGSGAGIIGSTVNPFAVGIAVDGINKSFAELGIHAEVNNGTAIALGAIVWLASFIVLCRFVMSYAEKVQKDKTQTCLSTAEQAVMQKEFGSAAGSLDTAFTGKMKLTMLIFSVAFAVMVIGVIPWGKFNVGIFSGWSSFLTECALGEWWFGELSMWFLLMSIVIGIVNRFSEKEFVEAFIEGTKEVIGVVLVIAVARGASVLMGQTGLDKYILEYAAHLLQGVPALVYAPLIYLLFGLLAFVIPSSSGLATVSMPIMGPLTYRLHHNPAVMVIIFSAASGLLNLFTPTSGVVMGGMAISKIEYRTWLKFVARALGLLLITNILILTLAMLIL